MRPKITTNKHTDDVPAFSQSEIKEDGKVYTPTPIVTDMLKRFTYFTDVTRSVCDPSCGQGNFIRAIFEARLTHHNNPTEIFQDFIWGFEKDPIAVDECKKYFIDRGVDKDIVDEQIICGDTLRAFVPYEHTYDDVIGNPPYVRNFSDYPTHINLTDNLCDAFFEVGMRLLKNQPNCHLVYITQDSFIANETSSLREYLLQFNIQTVEHKFTYSKIFRKHDIAVDIALIEVATGSQQQLINVERHETFTLHSNRFTKDKWLIYPEEVRQLADKLLQFGEPLLSYCDVKKGRTSNSSVAVPGSYSSANYKSSQSNTHSHGVLSEPNTDFFFPKNLTMTKFASEVVRADQDIAPPFIILPYFTSRFRFCLIEQDLLTTPLLYVLYGQDVIPLLPLLNSSVVDFIIRYVTKSRDTGYEFKQSTFDSIRVPQLDDQLTDILSELVSKVRDGKISQAKCNQIVTKQIYNLTDDEILIINQCKSYWFKKAGARKI